MRGTGVRNPNPAKCALTCHVFRHSFARHWKRMGGSIETLSKILGHQSIKTTWDCYGSEGLEDIRRNYARLMVRSERGHKEINTMDT